MHRHRALGEAHSVDSQLRNESDRRLEILLDVESLAGTVYIEGRRMPPGLLVRATLCTLPHTEARMATNLALDPRLLDQVLELSGEPTKKAAVTLALKEFIARREQKRVAELFGKLDWDSSYDYKVERSRP